MSVDWQTGNHVLDLSDTGCLFQDTVTTFEFFRLYSFVVFTSVDFIVVKAGSELAEEIFLNRRRFIVCNKSSGPKYCPWVLRSSADAFEGCGLSRPIYNLLFTICRDNFNCGVFVAIWIRCFMIIIFCLFIG